MLMKDFYISAYWTQREESAADCARRMALMLRQLAGAAGLFARWFDIGKRASARSRVDYNGDLEPFVAQNYFSDADGFPIPDMGFAIALWTGPNAEGRTRLNLHCGNHPSATEPHVCNNCTLDFPDVRDDTAAGRQIFHIDTISTIVRTLARSWEPNWALATSHDFREALGMKPVDLTEEHARVLRPRPQIPQVGWITAIPVLPARVPPLPAPTRVEELEEYGSLIVLTDEQPLASNPELIALAKHVATILEQAQVLHPLQYWNPVAYWKAKMDLP